MNSTDQVLAAVDLGSNSFHMIVARYRNGQLSIIDRIREMVRLAAGLEADGRLDADSQTRALDCLARFGERLRTLHAGNVRVAGTNTLRRISRADHFLDAATEALGHDIEVISGVEEARLVFLGATGDLPAIDGGQLVVDIGGGSTEVILGSGNSPDVMESLYMGCVGTSREFFSSGQLTKQAFADARMSARLELRPVVHKFPTRGWERATGSSGTIRTAAQVLTKLGLTQRVVTAQGLGELIDRMIRAGRLEDLHLDGLSDQRRPSFAGGVAILVEVMEVLGIEEMGTTEGALREGIIYDLLGRMTQEDARERTVRTMAAHYHVDQAQAQRVADTALQLLDQVREDWKLNGELPAQILRWAATLHEIGLDVAHARYHHHGAYLLANSDMAGFPWVEQRLLACVVEGHRRRVPSDFASSLPRRWSHTALRLTVLLRLAVLLHRGRSTEDIADVTLRASGKDFDIGISAESLMENPLTLADLDRERRWLDSAGIHLQLETRPT